MSKDRQYYLVARTEGIFTETHRAAAQKALEDVAPGIDAYFVELDENGFEDYWRGSLRRRHLEVVRRMADAVAERLPETRYDEEGPYHREPIEVLEQVVESHPWVIMTYLAKQTLLISPNDEEALAQLADTGATPGDAMLWSQAAFYALRQDVIDELQARGVEL